MVTKEIWWAALIKLQRGLKHYFRRKKLIRKMKLILKDNNTKLKEKVKSWWEGRKLWSIKDKSYLTTIKK